MQGLFYALVIILGFCFCWKIRMRYWVLGIALGVWRLRVRIGWPLASILFETVVCHSSLLTLWHIKNRRIRVRFDFYDIIDVLVYAIRFVFVLVLVHVRVSRVFLAFVFVQSSKLLHSRRSRFLIGNRNVPTSISVILYAYSCTRNSYATDPR